MAKGPAVGLAGTDAIARESSIYDGDVGASQRHGSLRRDFQITADPGLSCGYLLLSESSGASTTGYDAGSSKVHHRASSSLSSVVTPDQQDKEETPATSALKSPITELPLEDIRSFVQRALDGETEEGWPLRNFKVNPPPTDRPVRIYADGTFPYPTSSQAEAHKC